MTPLPSQRVLGTPVNICTYDSALAAACELARGPGPGMLTACNTHLVALARHDPGFAAVLRRFDLILPDGYPLVWALNRKGADLRDRVYGPYFMRFALEHLGPPWRHFFFGSTPQTLESLQAAARRLNPSIQIAGVLSPPFRPWTEEDEEDFAARIREAGADFIWVALGGGRQERWIAANLHRHKRGVFCAVGDAFLLLAGGRPFAPMWMQRRGLTWLYRLLQEPRRLWLRYLKFNSLFLLYSLRDALLPPKTGLRVAFLGSRGVPARYSGFEVVVENLGSRLASRGYEVTVYNRFPHSPPGLRRYGGMRVLTLPTIPTKSLDTIVHTALSSLHAVLRRYDIIYLCGVGNAVLGWVLRISGMRVVLNVDGADFRRSKWGLFARLWLRASEQAAPACADVIIADNPEIQKRYEKAYGVRPELLSYGAILRDQPVRCGELERWGLEARGYILYVSRLTPENEALPLIEAFVRWGGPMKLVVCGSHNYERRYYARLRAAANERVVFTGGRFGDAYIELSQNCAFFVMPAAIEATRLVLLDQMGMGTAILYREAAATREVVGEAAEPYEPGGLPGALDRLARNPQRCRELGALARARAEAQYSWERVTARYIEIFQSWAPPGQ